MNAKLAVHLVLLLLLLLHIVDCSNPEEQGFCQFVSSLTVHSKPSVPEICHIFHINLCETCDGLTSIVHMQYCSIEMELNLPIQCMTQVLNSSTTSIKAKLVCVKRCIDVAYAYSRLSSAAIPPPYTEACSPEGMAGQDSPKQISQEPVVQWNKALKSQQICAHQESAA